MRTVTRREGKEGKGGSMEGSMEKTGTVNKIKPGRVVMMVMMIPFFLPRGTHQLVSAIRQLLVLRIAKILVIPIIMATTAVHAAITII